MILLLFSFLKNNEQQFLLFTFIIYIYIEETVVFLK